MGEGRGLKQARIILVICAILVISLMLSSCFAQAQQTIVKVNFQTLFIDQNGNLTTDLYSGGWFYYNITVTNSGNSDLNATYTVTVYSPDGTVNGKTREFTVDLKTNQSGVLYPNETLLSPNDVDAHFADTVGTYEINVTCNVPVEFVRYANGNSSYTYTPNSYQMSN